MAIITTKVLWRWWWMRISGNTENFRHSLSNKWKILKKTKQNKKTMCVKPYIRLQDWWRLKTIMQNVPNCLTRNFHFHKVVLYIFENTWKLFIYIYIYACVCIYILNFFFYTNSIVARLPEKSFQLIHIQPTRDCRVGSMVVPLS